MVYDFLGLKNRVKEIEEHLKLELSGIRTGRATPLILDSVMVDSYGARTSLKHIASITIDDPKTLRVTAWDKSQMKAVETAVAAANLGVSVSPDSNGLRIIFPELSEERRKMFIKLAKEKVENSRILLRKERERIWNDIQAKERDGVISEDEKFRSKDGLQKMIDDSQHMFDDLASKKEKEILE